MEIIGRTLDQGEKHFCNYPTVGDWQAWTNGKILATVSSMASPDAEFVILLHEIIEAYLCRKRGITGEQVAAFDRIFELERGAGLHSSMAEPGDHPQAPYRREHQFSTMIEMAVFHELGGAWPDHCCDVADMPERKDNL